MINCSITTIDLPYFQSNPQERSIIEFNSHSNSKHTTQLIILLHHYPLDLVARSQSTHRMLEHVIRIPYNSQFVHSLFDPLSHPSSSPFPSYSFSSKAQFDLNKNINQCELSLPPSNQNHHYPDSFHPDYPLPQ